MCPPPVSSICFLVPMSFFLPSFFPFAFFVLSFLVSTPLFPIYHPCFSSVLFCLLSSYSFCLVLPSPSLMLSCCFFPCLHPVQSYPPYPFTSSYISFHIFSQLSFPFSLFLCPFCLQEKSRCPFISSFCPFSSCLLSLCLLLLPPMPTPFPSSHLLFSLHLSKHCARKPLNQSCT